jgi:hypothetical protein
MVPGSTSTVPIVIQTKAPDVYIQADTNMHEYKVAERNHTSTRNGAVKVGAKA